MTTRKKSKNISVSTPFQLRNSSNQIRTGELNIQLQPSPSGARLKHCPVIYTDHETGLSGIVGAVYLVQFRTGARISEVLQCLSCHILSKCEIYIRGKKRSHDRVAVVPELESQLAVYAGIPNGILFPVSYSKVYRQYTNAGIIQYTKSKQNNIVTHKVRHEYISRVQNQNQNVDETRHIVGHKAQSSTRHYLKRSIDHG